jgi:hypothetical protein
MEEAEKCHTQEDTTLGYVSHCEKTKGSHKPRERNLSWKGTELSCQTKTPKNGVVWGKV